MEHAFVVYVLVLFQKQRENVPIYVRNYMFMSYHQ